MNELSTVAKVGLLAFIGALAFLAASSWVGVSADAIVGLVGAVIGALIAASVQFATGRSEQLDRYRLAAIEHRLKAHQEAFALWWKLISKVHDDNQIESVVMECQDWWVHNCLYLEEETRKTFRFSYMCAANHKNFLRDRSNQELVKKNWADIVATGDALAKAVALPPIGELVKEYEKKALGKEGA